VTGPSAFAIPISSPGGHGERDVCAAAVIIVAAAVASTQTSRKVFIGHILDFQSKRDAAGLSIPFFRNPERILGLLQKLDLIGCRKSAEDRVTVRKPAITRNDIAVCHRIPKQIVVAEAADEFDRAVLVGKMFAVFERQVQEQAAIFVETLIKLAVDRAASHSQREMIGYKSARRGSKHVARELIKGDDSGQRPVGGHRRTVMIEMTHDMLVDCEKPCSNHRVDIGVRLEPDGPIEFLEPKGLNVINPGRL